MNHKQFAQIGALSLLFVMSLVEADTPASQSFTGKSVEFPPSYKYEIKPGEGDKTVLKCSMCHSLGYILNQGKQNRSFWEHETHKMVEAYKAPITPDEEKVIVDYLSKYYGKP